MLTLNQIIELFRNFSIKHRQLKDFYFGNEWEVAASTDIQYPLMWAQILSASYDPKTGVVTREWQIDMSDLVNRNESNENHVLSDTELMCYDFINYCEQISDSGEIGLFIGQTSNLTDYTEGRDDSASGWFFTFQTRNNIGAMSCDLPINEGPIFDGNYIYTGGNFSPNGCLPVIIKDQDGNIVATVQAGGTYTIIVMNQTEEKFVVAGGVGTTFTFANTPLFNYGVYVEGQRITEGLGFTLTGNTGTWLNDYTGLNASLVYNH